MMTLKGLGGADTLIGGDGTDTADYSDTGNAVNINLASNVATGGDAAGDTFDSVENIIGSAGNDVITGDTSDNAFSGGRGNDTLDGGSGDDTLDGGEGNDTLTGGSGTNTLTGGLGDDTFMGGAGKDQMDGGLGDSDTINYINSGEGVIVSFVDGTGKDGDAEGDRYTDIENATGSNFADTLTGNDKNNSLSGAQGQDILSGGEGDDTLDGGIY